MHRIILLSLLLSGMALAEAPQKKLSAEELKCKQQIEAYYALNRAKQHKPIQGISLIGLNQQTLHGTITQQGYCASWQELVSQLKKQHSAILDATEEMTGMPSPIR